MVDISIVIQTKVAKLVYYAPPNHFNRKTISYLEKVGGILDLF